MKKEDVETHYDRERLPAVNVKVDAWDWHTRAREAATDNGATWAESVVFEATCLAWTENDLVPEWLWEAACESEREYLDAWATGQDGDGMFPDHRVSIEYQGRSGGWACVRGLPDIENWDAIMLGRWARFAKIARSIADNVPYTMASLAYLNIFRPERDEKIAADRERREAETELATARY